MAGAENRDLIGLDPQPAVDPMTASGSTWVEAMFDAAKRWKEPAGSSEFDPDPPDSPNRSYCGTTEFDTPSYGSANVSVVRKPRPR